MPPPSAPRWKTFALWSIPVALVLALAGFFTARAAIDAYLRSDRFRIFVAQRAGETLRARTEVAPIHFDSANVYTDGLSANGSSLAPFSTLRVDGVRAELSWSRFFAHAWLVNQLDVQRVQVNLDGPREALPPGPVEMPPARNDASSSPWLPNRVEVNSATIREAQLNWRDGGLEGTALQIQPAEGGWNVEATGGRINQASLPQLGLDHAALRYAGTTLFVKNAEFRQAGGGSAVAHGEVDFTDRLELHASLKDIALTPYLTGDWRVRLKGDASGEISVRSKLPLQGDPEVSGNLSLAHGQLEALPVLDEIAAFTHAQQFRRLTLTRATAEFVRTGTSLAVRRLVAEAEGLVRVEGAFRVENAMIDGNFQVGVTPASLQWLPGSQARVFTEARAGYVWAPMRLTGPVNTPHEDLSARLVTAAGGALVEGVQDAIKDSSKVIKDAAKGALDLLFPPAK